MPTTPLPYPKKDEEYGWVESPTRRVRELWRAEAAYRTRYAAAGTRQQKALAFVAYAMECEWVGRYYR